MVVVHGDSCSESFASIEMSGMSSSSSSLLSKSLMEDVLNGLELHAFKTIRGIQGLIER